MRGAFIIILGLPPDPTTFFLFTILNIALVISSIDLSKIFSEAEKIKDFINLYVLNIFFGTVWFIGGLIIYGSFITPTRSFLFYYIIPIFILAVIQNKLKHIDKIIYSIGFIISLSCIAQFFICNIYPAGVFGIEIVRPFLIKIIPYGQEELFVRIGPLFRSHGLTGHYHDSANILVMILVFLVCSSLHSKYTFFKLILTVFLVLGLISTLSLSNIVCAIFSIGIFSFSSLKNFLRTVPIIIFTLIVCTFLISSIIDLKLFDEIFNQLDPSGSKFEAMKNFGENSFLEVIISMIIGFDRVSKISQVGSVSESALIVMLYDMGLFTFTLYFLLLLFPVSLFLKSNKLIRYEIWPYFITYISGLTTLIHYGSLFRSTSIFLFFLFYGRTFQVYLKVKKNLTLAGT